MYPVPFLKKLGESINYKALVGFIVARLAVTILEKLLIPLVYIYLIDEEKLNKLNVKINNYEINFGVIIREIFFTFIIIVGYVIYLKLSKQI